METKIRKKWTEQIVKCKKIAEEPRLNRDGFWKKYKNEEIKVNKE